MTSVVPTDLVASVRKMDGTRRFISLGVLVVAGVATWLLVRYVLASPYVPLFPEAVSLEEASRVTDQLAAGGWKFRLRANGSRIDVPMNERAEIRMALAGGGFAPGVCGAVTEFSLGAGELEQRMNREKSIRADLECTIQQMPGIDRARVSLTLPQRSVFADQRQPAKATVTIFPSRRTQFDFDQARGITEVVASAVDGLQSRDVVVVNGNTSMIVSNRIGTGAGAARPQELEIQREVEKDLSLKVGEMLLSALSYSEFRVQVAAELDWNQIQRRSQQYDPEAQAIIREETGEFPPGATGPGSPAFNQELRDSRYSVTLEDVTNSPGSVSRLSVSVSVDENAAFFGGADGAAPNPAVVAARLATVDSVVRGAVGIDSARGDRVVVTAVPFKPPETVDPSTLTASVDPLQMIDRYLRPGIALIAILAMTVISMRVLKTAKPQPPEAPASLPAAGEGALAKGEDGASLEDGAKPRIPRKLNASEHLQNAVRDEAESNPDTAVRVVKAWLSESGAS